MELSPGSVNSVISDLEVKLPLRLGGKRTEEEVTDTPEFLKLLGRLSEKLEPSGRTQSTQKKLEDQKKKTEDSKRKYLEASLKVESLQEVILRCELGNLTLPRASHETALVATLRTGLTLAEVGGMLDLGQIAGEQVTSLCLDSSDPRLK